MYKIEYTNKFKKSYLKLILQDKQLEKDFNEVVKILQKGEMLPIKYKDHKLKGDLKDYFDFHLRYDLVVIRCYVGLSLISFANIGTHSRLFD